MSARVCRSLLAGDGISAAWTAGVAFSSPASRLLQVGTAALLFFASSPLRADTVIPVPTATDSAVTIKLSTPAVSLPRFGFAPVRVSIENAAAQERTWRVAFQAGMRNQFPGVTTTERSITVPAGQTRDTWIYVPLAEPSTGTAQVIHPGGRGPAGFSGTLTPVVTITKTPTGTRVERIIPSPSRGPPLSTAITDINARTGMMTETTAMAGGTTGWRSNVPRPGADIVYTIDPVTGSVSVRMTTRSAGGLGSLASGPRSVNIVTAPSPATGPAGRAGPMPVPSAPVTIAQTPVGTKVTRVIGRLTLAKEIDATTGEITTITTMAGGRASPPTTSPPREPGTETIYTIDRISGNIRTDTLRTGNPSAPPKITIITGASPAGRATMVSATGPFTGPPIANATVIATVINMDVSGPGLAGGARVSLPNSISNGSQMRPFAASASLEPSIRSRLSTIVRGAPNLSGVDPAQLPADWRVWSSFAGVILSSDEFAALDAGRRAALRGWVGLGGRLWLSPSAVGDERVERFGAGLVTTLAEPLPDARSSGSLTAADQSTADFWVDKIQIYAGTPGLPDRNSLNLDTTPLGEAVQDVAGANAWLAIFLVVFAIVIGPVNLFVFAPVTKRHRLFVTTPIIASAAAVLLGTMIVTQDGLGGDGMRRALVVLLPGQNDAAVFQEQASRTGFLAHRAFPLADDTQLTVLDIDPMDPRLNFNATSTELARADGRASGDWFRSRGRQAQLLQRLVPTRGRVERVGTASGGEPIVQSSLGTALHSFSCVDAAGALWTAPELPPGKRVTLTQGGTWIGNTVLGGSHRFTEVLGAATPRAPGRWGARGGASDLAPIATLDTVRWTDADVVFTGVLEGTPARAKEENP